MLTATAFASGVANDLTAGGAAEASSRRAAEFTPATPGAAALTAAGQEGLPNCDISVTVKDDTMREQFAQYQDQYQNSGIEYNEGRVLINTELIKSLEYQGADATFSFTAPTDGKNTVKFQQGTDGSSSFSVYNQDGKLISAPSDIK